MPTSSQPSTAVKQKIWTKLPNPRQFYDPSQVRHTQKIIINVCIVYHHIRFWWLSLSCGTVGVCCEGHQNHKTWSGTKNAVCGISSLGILHRFYFLFGFILLLRANQIGIFANSVSLKFDYFKLYDWILFSKKWWNHMLFLTNIYDSMNIRTLFS